MSHSISAKFPRKIHFDIHGKKERRTRKNCRLAKWSFSGWIEMSARWHRARSFHFKAHKAHSKNQIHKWKTHWLNSKCELEHTKKWRVEQGEEQKKIYTNKIKATCSQQTFFSRFCCVLAHSMEKWKRDGSICGRASSCMCFCMCMLLLAVVFSFIVVLANHTEHESILSIRSMRSTETE